MKKIRVIAILTTAVCGFYFTSVAQTDTKTTTDKDKQTTTQSSQSKMQSNDRQQSDEISLSATPTAEKSSQGYKVQMWVLPEEGTSSTNFDTRYDSKSTKTGTDGYKHSMDKSKSKTTGSGTDYDRTPSTGTTGNTGAGVSGNVGTTGAGVQGNVGTTGAGVQGNVGTTGTDASGKVGTTGTGVSGKVGTTGTDATAKVGTTGAGVSGSVGTTGTTTQTDQSARTETARNENPAFNNQDFNDTVAAGTTSKTDLTDDWHARANPIGQDAGMEREKSTVVVKVIEESTGKEVNAEDIELKVITPSKRSITADLRHKDDHHTGELALTENGTYSVQTTIKTDDNKEVVIPFTFENKTDQFSDDLNNRNDNIDNDLNKDNDMNKEIE